MLTYMKRFWKDNLMMGCLLLGSAVSQTTASVINASALNALIGFDVAGFIRAAGAMFIAYIFFLGFTYLLIVKQTQTIQKMVTAIREDITKRIQQTSYKGFHEKKVGTYTSWLSNDMHTIESQTFEGIYQVISGIIGTISSVVALFFFHWSLVVWSLLVAGITLLLPKIYQKKMGEASLATTKENERFLSKTNDVLGGFDTLFSYSKLHKITLDIRAASLRLAQRKDTQARVTGKVAILGALGNVFGQLSILVLTGLLAFRSLLSIGSIATTGGLAVTIFNTVGNISQQLALIRSTQPIFDKFETIHLGETEANESLSELTSGFHLKDLSYAYGDKTIFEAMNYRFKLGKKYAVVGASGSGKSTLLNILNGKITDYQGSAELSDKELKQLKGQDLRKHTLYIDQTPYLFEGSIGYNNTLGDDFSEASLQKAIQGSDLEALISQLPHGLNTPVGEGGRSFSGGQRQRIALARGLIRGKTCILIDEGTSSLGEKSALKIEESLVENPELTVIMITHRMRDAIREKLDGVLELG